VRRRRQVRRRRLTALLLAAAVAIVAIVAFRGGDDGDRGEEAASTVAELDPAALAGLRLIAGWDGVDPPLGLRRLIESGAVAGVILFADNAPDATTARRTIRRLQALARAGGSAEPLLVMVDQEGGQVRRLDGPPTSSAARIGERGADVAREQGRRTGEHLAEIGFNVDLAPVLDVARAGGAIDREQRSFGSDAATVSELGVSGFAAGLREAGVAATAKHFPGIGMVETNTDFAAQRVALAEATLRGVDAVPFEAFVDAGGELVMLSLATYNAFADRPAAFSRKVVTGELRERLGFEGVTITDGLGAAAAAAFGDRPRVALAAVASGNDLLLYSDWRVAREVHRLLTRRLRRGEAERGEFERSAERVLQLRAALGRDPTPTEE
jgi:beta-N-acetylhexosaminidase